MQIICVRSTNIDAHPWLLEYGYMNKDSSILDNYGVNIVESIVFGIQIVVLS